MDPRTKIRNTYQKLLYVDTRKLKGVVGYHRVGIV